MGVESVRVLGRRLAVTVFALILPHSYSRAADKVALFKDQPSSDAWRRGFERQVAWAYTSLDIASSDSAQNAGSAQMLPGQASNGDWSYTFTFPSSGEGIYTLRYYTNSSNGDEHTQPAIPHVSIEHGAVRAGVCVCV